GSSAQSPARPGGAPGKVIPGEDDATREFRMRRNRITGKGDEGNWEEALATLFRASAVGAEIDARLFTAGLRACERTE
ncbi:unnamed protein product, partial [Polarella glacialis]